MPDLSTSQAAAELGLTRDTVSMYAAEGKFPTAYQLGARGPWRIPPTDLATFRESMRPTKSRDPHGVEPSGPKAQAARKAAATRNRKTA
jgi:excisionase family DNA binding protein